MSWGIAETASDFEKLRAESADYLGGLNSCGEIEWGIYSQAFDFYADLIQKAYELGKTEAKPHWIPVTERMPEDDTVVLVCGKSGGVYTAIHNNSKTWIRGWWKMNSKNHHCNPTAWMPLPTPFKVGKDDE